MKIHCVPAVSCMVIMCAGGIMRWGQSVVQSEDSCMWCLVRPQQQLPPVSKVQDMAHTLHHLSSLVVEAVPDVASGVHLENQAMSGEVVGHQSSQAQLNGERLAYHWEHIV